MAYFSQRGSYDGPDDIEDYDDGVPEYNDTTNHPKDYLDDDDEPFIPSYSPTPQPVQLITHQPSHRQSQSQIQRHLPFNPPARIITAPGPAQRAPIHIPSTARPQIPVPSQVAPPPSLPTQQRYSGYLQSQRHTPVHPTQLHLQIPPADSNLPQSQVQGNPAPRNAHGIHLKPVSLLPDMYRSFFKFGVFNAMQSKCFDAIMHSPDNLVISAPTGSGKTVLFELALIRLLMENDARDVKCVYMAPTKALCSERHRDWTSKFDPLGIKCCELTGDTVSLSTGHGKNALGEAKASSVIITTPEKFDSLSRNWRDHGSLLSRTQLFLIDEVHILNETRGSTLEVVASRMKTRGNAVRFILVSATVPNIQDVAAWIGNGKGRGEREDARVFNFGDEFRPCKLTRIVYGYPRRNQNDFSFNRMLDYKVLNILQQHAENKPVLVFCVVGTADVLAKGYRKLLGERQKVPWVKPARIDVVFHDKQLEEFAKVGIGVHHAGLTMDDRRATEDLFLKKIIRVVVATSVRFILLLLSTSSFYFCNSLIDAIFRPWPLA
ncbi:hypothetical protein M422DRAFT_779412 [Sphaerobolus stellatus SS14]|uniref:Helicase ATP-binding domain-containing protein n=1 Tax=Sphaerobolus stellatus (strain SS14) TaxID=990650 RepID=A0A0C9UMV2_SPHS4|nr:hypothetical protein M422DRAFT_779412 [Sphaerobolus stellatus SS14]